MDLADAYEQIVTVLRESEFLRRLIQILEKERRVKHAEENRHHDNWNLSDLLEFGFLKLDAEIIDRKRAFYSTFEDFVIKELPQPPLISADDLQEIALAQLGGMTDETKGIQFSRFIDHTLLRVRQFEGCESEIDLGDWTLVGNPEDDYRDGRLWDETEDGIPLANGFHLDVKIEGLGPVRARAFIRGICTSSAARCLTDKIGPAISSLVRSLKSSATNAELETARSSNLGKAYRLLDVLYGDLSRKLPLDIGSLCHCIEPFDRALQCALASLFIDSAFARRIENSLELTSHADKIENKAVALSLCVSALEALLCGKDRGTKNSLQLQSRVPALLQADRQLASESADSIRALYQVRNRCMHGEDVSTLHEVAEVRKLVAAVLRASLEWAVHESDIPNQIKESAWTTELKTATSTSRSVTGVNYDLVEHLKSFTDAFGKDRLKELFDEGDDE